MTPQTIKTNDEAQIRRLITQEADAIAAKDVGPIMARMPNSFRMETRDLAVHISGDLALAHWRFRFNGMENDHPATQTWMRNTVACQRRQGEWQVVPGHWSVPFNPETSTAVFTIEP